MYLYNKYTHQKIYKQEARDYLEANAWTVKKSMKGFAPIEDYTHVWFKFWLPRRSADSHNYYKLAADALEQGGFTVNDKFIMVMTESVDFDSKNPRIEISAKLEAVKGRRNPDYPPSKGFSG